MTEQEPRIGGFTLAKWADAFESLRYSLATESIDGGGIHELLDEAFAAAALRKLIEESEQEIAILRAALCLEHGAAHGGPDPSKWDKTDCDICALLKFNPKR